MLFATVGQGSVFIWMLSAGFLIGLLYDCFRLIRWLTHAGTPLSLFLDALWGAASGAVFCGMLISANYGQLRLYTLTAAGAGFLLYLTAVSVPAEALCRKLLNTLMHFVKILSRFRLFKFVFR